MHVIDLRSDTITKPTRQMRRAMADAEVGDDVFGEDPTVNRLEEVAAERVGKEAAVFMPSGTMVNQAAIWVHSRRQGAIIVEEGAHCFAYEAGAPALLSNVLVKTIHGDRGVLTPDEVLAALPPDQAHFAPVRLVAIENTHNRAGGTCWTPRQTQAMADACHEKGIPVHLDGARVFNAAIAQGIDVKRLTEPVDSVAFCFSKGLSAPVGSVLCGPSAFVQEARRARKIFGGGMRQAGVLAAAGLVALETMIERLADDHANALRLARRLATVPGLDIDLESVQTNIVVIDVKGTGRSAADFCTGLEAKGVRSLPRDTGHAVRMVTHRHVSSDDIDLAAERVESFLKTKVAPKPPA